MNNKEVKFPKNKQEVSKETILSFISYKRYIFENFEINDKKDFIFIFQIYNYIYLVYL